MKNLLWWVATLTLVVAAWLGMEQLTWVQELRPGVDSMVRFGLSTVVLGAAAALNPFTEDGTGQEQVPAR